MKTADFIKAVKGLGLSVYKYSSNTIEVKDNSNCKVVCIATEGMYVLDTDFIAFVGLDETIRKKLLALAVEHSTTPLEEREGEKRYRLKLNAPILIDNDEVFLNFNLDDDDYAIDTEKESVFYKTIFTETELSQMDETGFARILVEEEEK